jgi:hypothetical protein
MEQTLIENWLENAGKEFPEEVSIPSEDDRKLFVGLMLEELTEFVEANPTMLLWYAELLKKKAEECKAISDETTNMLPNLVDSVDALADLRVVLGNGIYFYGLGSSEWLNVVKEVMRSNFSKFVEPKEEAIASVEKYKALGVETYYEKYCDLYVIRRSSDKKILKGLRYTEPELQKLL